MHCTWQKLIGNGFSIALCYDFYGVHLQTFSHTNPDKILRYVNIHKKRMHKVLSGLLSSQFAIIMRLEVGKELQQMS